MATSNTRPSSEPTPWIAIVLSVVFLLVMVVSIIWVIQPTTSGYVNAPHTENPTQIAIP